MAVDRPVAKPKESEQISQFQEALRRLNRNRMALVGLGIISLFVLCAALAPWIAPHDPTTTSLRHTLEGPSLQNPLGRDELGRDNLSRILYGARISLSIGLISVAIGTLVGIPIGAISGYYGGKTDLLVQRLIDIMLAFPGILLAIVIVSTLGVGLPNVMIAVGIVSIPIYVRLVRGSVLSIKEQEYVSAARALGSSDRRIIFRHILPNCLGPIIVQSTLQIATAILWAAGLGFLGLGAQPPTPEWGTMLSRGRVYLRVAPHVTTFPGLAIVLSVLGFNLLGDGLRDALDPRLKR
ncbi:MAG: ABC transporter permease [Dehalococcoidia bacterium]|nr:Glutathione transport system permease protein GsiD [Chloroflexota bacterium]MBT9161890.1 Glutathione transport system permease protein GsiD [Chloroflexota bacterium]